jgi:queuine/archaeosine tRNA-ribosyltransferase
MEEIRSAIEEEKFDDLKKSIMAAAKSAPVDEKEV